MWSDRQRLSQLVSPIPLDSIDRSLAGSMHVPGLNAHQRFIITAYVLKSTEQWCGVLELIYSLCSELSYILCLVKVKLSKLGLRVRKYYYLRLKM
jgi:hypothetical protein